jgi:AcrR family transcriptional regulator
MQAAHAGTAQDSATRRRILRAASEEFARHGYAGARVRSIVDAARVNLAAINYYFGGKLGLYHATLGHLAELAMAPGPSRREERRGQTPQRRLHRLVYEFLEGLSPGASSPPLGRILAHEAMDPSPQLERVFETIAGPQLARLRALVRELAGPRVSEAEVTLSTLSIAGQCLLYVFGGAAVERIHPGIARGPEARRRLARQITEFSVAGITRLPSTRERRRGWRGH